jgi:hypothetical protein
MYKVSKAILVLKVKSITKWRKKSVSPTSILIEQKDVPS